MAEVPKDQNPAPAAAVRVIESHSVPMLDVSTLPQDSGGTLKHSAKR